MQDLRTRNFHYCLGTDASPEFFAAESAAALWAQRARHNAAVKPEERNGFLVPYDVRPTAAFGRRTPDIPESMV